MYTIIVNDDNSLVRSKTETIMERSTNVNYIHFLVKPTYRSQQGDEIDMTGFAAMLEYRTPISKKYVTEALVPADDLYKDTYIEYKLPISTSFTAEAGELEIKLTFTDVKTNADGTTTQMVRKTDSTTVYITPLTDWGDTVPDAALTAIDQRIIAMDKLVDQLNAVAAQYQANVPVGMKMDGNKLYLIKSDGSYIGDGVTIQGTIISETTGDMKVVSI
jgi:hypothetical protein